MKESTLQKNIAAMLRQQGAYVFNVHGSPFQQVGTPDLLVCYQGRFIGLEVKLPGEKPSPMQKVELRKIEHAGGRVLVAHSLAEVEGCL